MITTIMAGFAFGVLVLIVAGLSLEAWILGIILSWFNVSLTFWQNLLIIVLANAIFKPTGGSSN